MEFESRRGDILNMFFAKNKKDQLLRAPSVGRHNSTGSRRGKKELKSSRDKKCKARTAVVGRGEEEPAM